MQINSANFEATIERMIQISKEKPLLPETFVPWADEPGVHTLFLPEKMVSLEGHALWNTLSKEQQVELGRLEVVQAMYSYAWSETLACLFFNRHLLQLNPDSLEYRFLIREVIEEFRHQEMFGMAIRKLNRVAVLPTGLHKFFGNFTVKYLPAPLVFMSVLTIEMIADVYAKNCRKDEKVFSVIRKTSELHHIEEGRHIFYTEAWLEKYTRKAGFFKASVYSIIILLNIYFIRTLYVKKIFFQQIGVSDPEKYYKEAVKNFRVKFAEYTLASIADFVKSFNGFNWLTKPLWRRIAKLKL
ncbi:MAG: diiron oxygenase [Chitinophagaceae bacterium]|nr:diiron oxygenase [Chitinophagaceae bacterium]MCW5929620.1 diiron oxygenase [Chitinophagaceae bacterium]